MYYESNESTQRFPQPNSRQKAKSLPAKFLQREAVRKSQETLSNRKSLGSVQLAIPLQAREQGAWMTLLCFSPVLWLVERLLKTICSWGSTKAALRLLGLIAGMNMSWRCSRGHRGAHSNWPEAVLSIAQIQMFLLPAAFPNIHCKHYDVNTKGLTS